MSWKVEDKSLVKEFEFTNFSEAIKFINEIHFLPENRRSTFLKRKLNEILEPSVMKEYESELIAGAIDSNPLLILLGILGFVAAFAVSLGPVMWVMFSELFPNWIRGLAISFVGFINSAVSFSVQLIFPWELSTLGTAGTFLIYGIFGAIGLIFVLMVVPETKGKSLEELEKILVKSKS